MSSRCLVVLLSVVLLLWPASALRHDSLALPIPARKKLCVHEDFLQNQRKILDVFVEKGGALDIDVQVICMLLLLLLRAIWGWSWCVG